VLGLINGHGWQKMKVDYPATDKRLTNDGNACQEGGEATEFKRVLF